METTRILHDELIGREILVIDSKNKINIGIKGKIVDETKNSIIVMQERKKLRLLKNNIVLQTRSDGRIIQIQASLFGLRPEERAKGHKTVKA